MAPILRGAPLGSENERAIFAFFTLVSYIGSHAPYRQTERGDSYNIDVSFHDLKRGSLRSITIEKGRAP